MRSLTHVLNNFHYAFLGLSMNQLRTKNILTIGNTNKFRKIESFWQLGHLSASSQHRKIVFELLIKVFVLWDFKSTMRDLGFFLISGFLSWEFSRNLRDLCKIPGTRNFSGFLIFGISRGFFFHRMRYLDKKPPLLLTTSDIGGTNVPGVGGRMSHYDYCVYDFLRSLKWKYYFRCTNFLRQGYFGNVFRNNF